MKFNTKKVFTILVIILIIIFIIFLNNDRNNKTIKSTATVVPKVIYKNLEIGKSTRNDVIREIGAPQKEFSENGSTIIEYQTRNPNYNDQYVIINNSLDFVREIITIDNPIRISDIENKYGDESTILYGPGSGISFYLYVYLKNGVAYIGHKESGRIIEIWYFKPTDIDSFITNYAKDYYKNKQISQ